MLDEHTKERLKANWGDKAECMACNAELRLFDPLSSWECYLLAINPLDENESKVILVNEAHEVQVLQANMLDLFGRWNGEGEYMEIDPMFKPRQASALFKVLNERNP